MSAASVALYRLLRELYPMATHRRFRLTRHAVERARWRWMEPTRAAAEEAIWEVLRKGTPSPVEGEGRIGIRCGRRTCVVAPNGTVVTVWVDGKDRVENMVQRVRLDRQRRPKRR